MSDPNTVSSASVTFAQVADKAIDRLSAGTGHLVSEAEKFASAFISRVDQIAPQVAAELKKITLYAWECMIRQKRAEGIFYLIAGIGIIPLYYLWYKYFVKRLWASDDGAAVGWGWAVFVVISVAATILMPFFLYCGIKYLISPEYYAVFDLIKNINEAMHPGQ